MMDFGVGMDLGRVQQFSCLLFSRSLFLLQGRRSASCRWGGWCNWWPCNCLLFTCERVLPLIADNKGAVSQVVLV